MMLAFFKHKFALVCNGIPNSLVNGLSLEEHEQIDLEKARQQHLVYLNELQKLGVSLIAVEPDEAYPDCVFVEDTAVALGNRVFITNPGALSRRGETKAIENKLNSLKQELGLEIGKIHNVNEAFMDGGDVLFTGREFIVGLSNRTNQKGKLFYH